MRAAIKSSFGRHKVGSRLDTRRLYAFGPPAGNCKQFFAQDTPVLISPCVGRPSSYIHKLIHSKTNDVTQELKGRSYRIVDPAPPPKVKATNGQLLKMERLIDRPNQTALAQNKDENGNRGG